MHVNSKNYERGEKINDYFLDHAIQSITYAMSGQHAVGSKLAKSSTLYIRIIIVLKLPWYNLITTLILERFLYRKSLCIA